MIVAEVLVCIPLDFAEFSAQKKMSHVKPQLDELDVELKDLAWSEVKQLAVQLKVEYPTLRKIEEKYNRDTEPCLLAAMQCWLEGDTTASWGKIVDALRAIDKGVLAGEIEEKYSSLATPLEPQTNHPRESSAPLIVTINTGERSLFLSLFHNLSVCHISLSPRQQSITETCDHLTSERSRSFPKLYDNK